MLLLVLLFIVLPMAELSLLIRVGSALGGPLTLFLILGTGVLGASLARRAGLGVLGRMQSQLGAGQMPTATLLEGVAVLLAGVLLITPGLITDAAGLLLLLPVTRRMLLARLWDRLDKAVAGGGVHFSMRGFTGGAGPTSGPTGPIRDVEILDQSPVESDSRESSADAGDEPSDTDPSAPSRG